MQHTAPALTSALSMGQTCTEMQTEPMGSLCCVLGLRRSMWIHVESGGSMSYRPGCGRITIT